MTATTQPSTSIAIYVAGALILAFITILLLSFFGGPQGAPERGSNEESASSVTWTPVASWRGNGIKETEGFTVGSREWRIRWSSGNEPFANAGLLQIFVKTEAGETVSIAANKQGPGGDVSYVRAPPGRYYLQINSANIDWDITIEDQR